MMKRQVSGDVRFMGAILLLLTACGKQGSAAKSSSSAWLKLHTGIG